MNIRIKLNQFSLWFSIYFLACLTSSAQNTDDRLWAAIQMDLIRQQPGISTEELHATIAQIMDVPPAQGTISSDVEQIVEQLDEAVHASADERFRLLEILEHRLDPSFVSNQNSRELDSLREGLRRLFDAMDSEYHEEDHFLDYHFQAPQNQVISLLRRLNEISSDPSPNPNPLPAQSFELADFLTWPTPALEEFFQTETEDTAQEQPARRRRGRPRVDKLAKQRILTDLNFRLRESIVRLQDKNHDAPVNLGRLWGNFNKCATRSDFDEVLEILVESGEFEFVYKTGRCIRYLEQD